MTPYLRFSALSLVLALALPAPASLSVNFEDLPLGNPPVDGSIEYNSSGTHYWNGFNGSGDFSSGGAVLNNSYNSLWSTWAGFAYSNSTDGTTSGFGNQYSARPGGGAGASSTYGIGYQSDFDSIFPSITFAAPLDFGLGASAQVTNTTYTARDMENGSGFSKKFGGATGDDPDWFRLTITGYLSNSPTTSVEFYLADFRFADTADDYILDSWESVDLQSLGLVDEVRFSLSSSDSGAFGMNTPSYFALDNLEVIPEPGVAGLLLLGVLTCLQIRRRIGRSL